jgi:TadE-like protein
MGTVGRQVRGSRRGQSLVEFALVFPIFLLVVMGIVVLGLTIFYTQEVTNAAREAARYAAIHSSTAQCPTVSWKNPQVPPNSYYRCDPPASWPNMVAAGRSKIWGLDASAVYINACWSGYRHQVSDPLADSPAVDPATGLPNTYVQCTMAGTDPVASSSTLGCGPSLTTSADDAASDQPQNRVTAYACVVWRPPMAGFLLIPSQLTIRGVITQDIQRQQ